MELAVIMIRPNPFRHIEKYPIDRAKVDALKVSIEQTDFWDNLLVRVKAPGRIIDSYAGYLDEGYGSGDSSYNQVAVGKPIPERDEEDYDDDRRLIIQETFENWASYEHPTFELAYGHHRLQAIKELGIERIDIPVKNLDDATMLRIMANENMDDWKSSPVVINETVSAAKEFIDAELARYETWEEFHSNSVITMEVKSPANWGKMRESGAGQKSILHFLGGNWKQWMIQEALATINSEIVDREAVETFNSPKAAQSFREAVTRNEIPKPKQKELAESIVKSGRTSKREIPKAVDEVVKKKHRKEMEKIRPSIKPPQDIEALRKDVIQARKGMVSAGSGLSDLTERIKRMGVEELAGVEAMDLRLETKLTLKLIEKIAPFIGLEMTWRDIDE